MSAPALDGRVGRRAATRSKVTEAATVLFAEHGYAATTIEEIAAAAGVSKGAVFYNFDSKENLFTSILTSTVSRTAAVVEEATAEVAGPEALRALIPAVLSAVDESPAMFQLMTMELFRSARPWHPDLPRLRRELLAPLVVVIDQIRAARRAQGRAAMGDADAESVAMAMLGALCFAALDRLAFFPERRLQDVEAVLAAVVTGLVAG